MNVNARIKMGLSALLCLLVLLGVVFSAAYASEENTMTLGLSLDSPVEYPVLVKGIRVTGANMEDVLGDGKVSYNPSNFTLTLSNATIEATADGVAAIRSFYPDYTLKIVGEGVNTISATGGSGIYAKNQNISLSGGTFLISGSINGIFSENGTVTISNAQVEASGANAGVYGKNGITVNGGGLLAVQGSDASVRGTYTMGSETFNTLAVAENAVLTIAGDATVTVEETIDSSGSIIINGTLKVPAGSGRTTMSGGTLYVGQKGFLWNETDGVYRCLNEHAINTVTGNCSDCGLYLAVASVTDANGVTTYYSSLESALSAAKTASQSTVKLLQSITGLQTTVVISGGSFTLDLNGYTIESSADYTLAVNGGSNLKITDTSSQKAGAVLGSLHIFQSAKVEFAGGNLTSEKNYAVMNDGYGMLTVTGGSITGQNNGIGCRNSTLIISGGIVSGVTAVLGSNASQITVSGGEIIGNDVGLQIEGANASAEIKENASITAQGNDGRVLVSIGRTITVSDGTFSGATIAKTFSSGTITFSGGSFPEGIAVSGDLTKLQEILAPCFGIQIGGEFLDAAALSQKSAQGSATIQPNHSWTYTAAGNTITAACANTSCPSTKQELKIIAPTLTVYGGSGSEKATLSASAIGGLTVLPEIRYEQKNGESWNALSAAPAVPGSYRASVTVDADKTAYAEYAIDQAELTVSGTGIASGSYGAKLSELAVSGLTVTLNSAEVPGVWTLIGDEVPDVNDSSSYTATFTPSAGAEYYKPLTAQVTLNITPGSQPAPEEIAVDISPSHVVVQGKAGITTLIIGKGLPNLSADNFASLTVDGTRVAPGGDTFGVHTGSVIIQLNPAYLNTLSLGDHRLVVELRGGAYEGIAVEAQIKVVSETEEDIASALPQTGDSGYPAEWTAAMLIALLGAVLLAGKRQKA